MWGREGGGGEAAGERAGPGRGEGEGGGVMVLRGGHGPAAQIAAAAAAMAVVTLLVPEVQKLGLRAAWQVPLNTVAVLPVKCGGRRWFFHGPTPEAGA